MKKIITAAIMASMVLATTAQAGSLVYTPEQAPIIVEEEAPMGSSGAWIIPLIGIGLICLIICGGDDNGNGQNGNGQNGNGLNGNVFNGNDQV